MISRTSETALRDENHCDFCKGRLPSHGFHYTCHVCGAGYCYTHMERHAGAHAKQSPRPAGGQVESPTA